MGTSTGGSGAFQHRRSKSTPASRRKFRGRCGLASGQPAGPVACSRAGPARNRNPMKALLLRFFTWWNGQTFGTQLWTWRFGELVGTDEYGNRYFRSRGGKIDPVLGFDRRWV